jgi:hypothetical protein
LKTNISVTYKDLSIKQVASTQLRKMKNKQKLSLQQVPLMVPESLSAPPSIKWSPNCLKAVQHRSEDEKVIHKTKYSMHTPDAEN